MFASPADYDNNSKMVRYRLERTRCEQTRSFSSAAQFALALTTVSEGVFLHTHKSLRVFGLVENERAPSDITNKRAAGVECQEERG